MKNWKRSADPEYPRVWYRFKGKRPMPDGTFPTFRVQDLTPDMWKEAVDFMCSDFLLNEPLCKATGAVNEPICVEQMRKLWFEALEDNVALVCFRENPDNPDEVFPEIVGANITTVSCEDDKDDVVMEGACYPIVLGVVYYTAKLVNIFEKYNVDKYLGAMGLSVAEKYKGQNIGAEILKARIPLCKALGIKVTGTVFTAIESQTLARKIGFMELDKVSYAELTKLFGKQLTSVQTKDCYLMALPIN